MTDVRTVTLTVLVLAGLACADEARAAFPGTNGTVAYVARSSTGQRLIEDAFVRSEGTLVPASPELRETAVDQGGESFNPAWSADGRELAFVSTRTGHRQIYSIALSLGGSLPQSCGVQVCPLTTGAAESFEPAWSYSGGSIVFVGTASGTPQLYMMSATGENVTRLSFDGATDQQPAWSRSGEIAFVSDATGSPQIYLMNSQGEDLHQLTHSGVHLAPTWSPGGTELAYESQTPAGFQLTTVEPSQAIPMAVSYPTPEPSRPTYSPDGTQLLVSRGPSPTGSTMLELVSTIQGFELAPRHLLGVGEDGDWAPLPVVAPSGRAPGGPAPGSPAPVLAAVSAIARPLSGSVSVNPGHGLATKQASELTTEDGRYQHLPATSSLTQAVEVPVNATYNTTHGTVEIVLASATASPPETAVVTGGDFLLSQPSDTKIPSVRLLGRPSGCARAHGRVAVARRRRRLPHVRAHTKGRFHQAGEYGGGSTETTRWEITNTCQGTLYRAIEHTLIVTDPHRRHPVRVTEGHSYLVRPGR